MSKQPETTKEILNKLWKEWLETSPLSRACIGCSCLTVIGFLIVLIIWLIAI